MPQIQHFSDFIFDDHRISFHGHYYKINFRGFNFRGSHIIHENSEIYVPRKFARARYVIVVTWTRVLCLICMPKARGLRAYISGKARVPMLQLICYTFGTLKSAQNLTSIFPSVYIVTDSNYDCGS